MPQAATQLAVPARAPGRDAGLDALRGLAALLVVLGHLRDLNPSTPTAGLADFVILFFPLSGFLIAGPFLRALVDGRQLPSIAGYGLRRAARILPAYWLTLIAVALLLPGAVAGSWWPLPLHATLMHGLVPGQLGTVLPVAWTLSIEALFYILVPLAAVAAYRALRGRALSPNALAAGIFGLWQASMVWNIVVRAIPSEALGPQSAALLRLTLPAYLCAFCPGMLVAVAETDRARRLGGAWSWYRALQRRPQLTLLLVAILWIPLIPGVGPRLPQTYGIAGDLYLLGGAAGAGLVLTMMVRPGRWGRRVATVLAPLGVISYGVYLWHTVLINLALEHARWLTRAGWAVDVVAILGGSVAVATLSWLLVERRVINAAAAHVARWARPARPLDDDAAVEGQLRRSGAATVTERAG